MAENIQDSLFKTIEVLMNKRIDSLQRDKTITAIVEECSNAITNEYKLLYNGGYITATAQEGASYSKNTSVYVLVPENDFGNTKYIVGRTQNISNDQNISFVSSALANYNLIGKNVISPSIDGTVEQTTIIKTGQKNEEGKDELKTITYLEPEEVYPQGLSSYLQKDYVVFYNRDNIVEKNRIIAEAEAKALKEEEEKAEKDKRQPNYSLEVKVDIPKELKNLVTIDDISFSNCIQEAEALMIESSFRTALPKAHRTVTSGNYGINFILAFKDNITTKSQVEYENAKSTDENNGIKYVTYPLDIKHMTGNPYSFGNWSDQYNIYPIDTENFLFVQAIVGYCENFVEETNPTKDNDTIWIKDLEIYGLKSISNESNGYKLKISMPQGNTFKSINSYDSLQILASVTKDYTDLSNQVTYYWFAEDVQVGPGNELYSPYAGSGWRLLNQSNSYYIELSADSNLSYKNRYKCIAIHKDLMILTESFTIFNEVAKIDLSIESDQGFTFSFDIGNPTLTCLINGRSENFDALVNLEQAAEQDMKYFFIWSRIDADGTSCIYNISAKDTEEQIQKIQKDETIKDKWQQTQSLREYLDKVKNIDFEVGKNKISFPIKSIASNSTTTFKCSVYKENNLLGTAEATLSNFSIALPQRYSIVIENGGQVFQYTESGVSPADTSVKEPISISPLSCHFYDNETGVEIESSQYSVSWKFPSKNTMIVPKTVGSPIGDDQKISYSSVFDFNINKNYNYLANNNQIVCTVKYYGEDYSKQTNFLFTKIGENGTNGTNIVAKISPTDKTGLGLFSNECLTLYTNDFTSSSNQGSYWNSQIGANSQPTIIDTVDAFDLSLYERNELVDDSDISSVDWSFAGSTTKNNNKLYIIESGESKNKARLSKQKPPDEKKLWSQIVKAEAKYKGNSYYAFYPFCSVTNKELESSSEAKSLQNIYRLIVQDDKTLKYVTYNSDGRNPVYNKNQGAKIKLEWNGSYEDKEVQTEFSGYVKWKIKGGLNDESPNFRIATDSKTTFEKAEERLVTRIITFEEAVAKFEEENDLEKGYATYEQREEIRSTFVPNEAMIYVIPSETYDGQYCNNRIHGWITTTPEDVSEENDKNVIISFDIPIHFALNTNELASLNAWDGNHIEINEDENYILAPQIGAGIKEDGNKFTGIVMGTEKRQEKVNNTTGELEERTDVGLLGYSKGQQSIFLDAKTGNATFGLVEKTGDHFQGRIELRPNKISRIGKWILGSEFLFNMDDESVFKDNDGNVDPKKIPPYSGTGYNISIPHQNSGILLSASPYYISVKGKQLTEGISYDSASTDVDPYDSLELQLDPNENSLFAIYRHTRYPNDPKDDNKVYTFDGEKIKDNNGTIYSTYVKKENDNDRKLWIINNKKENNIIVAFPYGNKWGIAEVKGNNADSFKKGTNVYAYKNYVQNAKIKDDGSGELEDNSKYNYLYRRERTVGIDENGRFYSNALKNNTSALNLGRVGAFGQSASVGQYMGVIFDSGKENDETKTFFKIFKKVKGFEKDESHFSPVYLSGAYKSTDSEYSRNLQMYGKEIYLYGDPSVTTSGERKKETSDNYLKIAPGEGKFSFAGKGNLSFQGGKTDLESNSVLNLKANNGAVNIEASANIILKNNKNDTILKLTNASTGNAGMEYVNLTTPKYNLSSTSQQITLKRKESDGNKSVNILAFTDNYSCLRGPGSTTSGDEGNETYGITSSLKLNKTGSLVLDGANLNVTTSNSITMTTDNKSNITLKAKRTANNKDISSRLTLNASDGTFSLSSEAATINSTFKLNFADHDLNTGYDQGVSIGCSKINKLRAPNIWGKTDLIGRVYRNESKTELASLSFAGITLNPGDDVIIPTTANLTKKQQEQKVKTKSCITCGEFKFWDGTQPEFKYYDDEKLKNELSNKETNLTDIIMILAKAIRRVRNRVENDCVKKTDFNSHTHKYLNTKYEFTDKTYGRYEFKDIGVDHNGLYTDIDDNEYRICGFLLTGWRYDDTNQNQNPIHDTEKPTIQL